MQAATREPDDRLGARADFCRDIARRAGAVALDGFRSMTPGAVRMKGPQDFLTETDAAVERMVREAIAQAFPNDGFLGEETGGTEGRDTWVVDPIDGTANFARGLPHFCVAIAFVRDGATEIGTIFNPVLDELHFARRGLGARRNGTPIVVAPTRDLDAASVEIGWSTRVPNARYVQIVGSLLDLGVNVRRGASGALGLAFVADGRSDGYAEVHMNAWDCLAGLLLVEEAGGRVGRFFRQGSLASGGPVIAAAPGIAGAFAAATGLTLDD